MIVIDCKPFVRVDRDAKETRVGVDHKSSVPFRQIVDYRRFREICHVSQVFQQLVLRWVLKVNLVLLNIII